MSAGKLKWVYRLACKVGNCRRLVAAEAGLNLILAPMGANICRRRHFDLLFFIYVNTLQCYIRSFQVTMVRVVKDLYKPLHNVS
jgi:hypothetical protein